jgi:GTP:adenosylcobinamide-phosphate guanylyltransferase
MEAILLAGGIPQPHEPLYQECHGKSKALIGVAGKPMAQWVLDALSPVKQISRVTIIGVNASEGLTCEKPLTFLQDQGGLLENILQGIAYVRATAPSTSHVLLSTTDIPTITPEMVEWRLEAAMADKADLDYAVVERSTMEARFPESNRSFLRLRDVEVCGGDLNVIHVKLAEKTDLWDRLIAARKSARRQAALLGYDLLLLLLSRRITLQGGRQKISRRLGIDGQVVISPYAELAMDVDKPEQLAIVRSDLEAWRAAQ